MEILVVEDDKSTQMLLEHGLKKRGFKPTIVDNLKAAVDYAKRVKPDIAIVDMELRCSRGIDFINKVKVGLGLKTKIIVFSANLDILRDWKDQDAKVDFAIEKGHADSFPQLFRNVNIC